MVAVERCSVRWELQTGVRGAIRGPRIKALVLKKKLNLELELRKKEKKY